MCLQCSMKPIIVFPSLSTTSILMLYMDVGEQNFNFFFTMWLIGLSCFELLLLDLGWFVNLIWIVDKDEAIYIIQHLIWFCDAKYIYYVSESTFLAKMECFAFRLF